MEEKLDIGEICSRSVVIATEDMSVKQAANLMRVEHVGSLVVVRDTQAGRVVVGMLTDRDIAIGAVARDFDPQTLRVDDIMAIDVISAHPRDSVYEALNRMRNNGVRRLPVTDEKNLLIGIVSQDDLLEVFAEEMEVFAQAVISQRKKEQRLSV